MTRGSLQTGRHHDFASDRIPPMMPPYPCFARRVKKIRKIRNSLFQQGAATVHGVVFDVLIVGPPEKAR
jgi:hypothetical protein